MVSIITGFGLLSFTIEYSLFSLSSASGVSKTLSISVVYGVACAKTPTFTFSSKFDN